MGEETYRRKRSIRFAGRAAMVLGTITSLVLISNDLSSVSVRANTPYALFWTSKSVMDVSKSQWSSSGASAIMPMGTGRELVLVREQAMQKGKGERIQ